MPFVQNTLKLTGPVKYPVKGEFRLNARNVSVPISAIGRYAGGGTRQPSKHFQAEASRMRDRAMDLSDLAAVYAIYPEAVCRNHANIFPRGCDFVDEAEAGISHIILAVCTLGPELEKAAEEYAASQNMLEACLLDAAGTALLQAFSLELKAMLAKVAEKSGLYWACDFTPGCGPVALEAQTEIFRLADADRIGVRLLESAMLRPLKSISFIAGLSARPSEFVPRKTCEKCPHSTCQFREEKVGCL